MFFPSRFESSVVVRGLRAGLQADGVDNRIIVFESGFLTEIAVHFDLGGRKVASDTPAHAMAAYQSRRGVRWLASQDTGDTLLSVPHSLPYAADAAVPWRLTSETPRIPF